MDRWMNMSIERRIVPLPSHNKWIRYGNRWIATATVAGMIESLQQTQPNTMYIRSKPTKRGIVDVLKERRLSHPITAYVWYIITSYSWNRNITYTITRLYDKWKWTLHWFNRDHFWSSLLKVFIQELAQDVRVWGIIESLECIQYYIGRIPCWHIHKFLYIIYYIL